jgi:hypothetical protein
MAIPLADGFCPPCASGCSCSVPARDRAVHGEKNRVRCGRPRCDAPVVRRNRDEAWPAWRWWCPRIARTRARERREGLAADGRQRRRSPDRDAGASCGSCDACISAPRAGHRDDACFLRSLDPCDEIAPSCRHRSASRDPRRWLARIRIHPVRRGGVPRARARQGGAPA